VRSLCGLLVALPHFNLRESLLQALVPRMDAADDVISQLCCDAMRDLFGGRGSAHQEATLEAVQLIADFVRISCLISVFCFHCD
jgi:nucleolar complex protein 3